jgi:hypothetical protein
MALGYIAPVAPLPIYAETLENVFHDLIQGVCGIADGSLVRPRWQPEPVNQPAFSTDWVAFGIQTYNADTFAYVKHDPAGNGGAGESELQRDEQLRVLMSFYGPNGDALETRFRDGLQIEQNRVNLGVQGVKLVQLLEATQLPALLMDKWVRRIDVAGLFNRRITRRYTVGTLVSSTVALNNEQYITNISVTNP